MVIADDAIKDYDVSTLRTVSIEYHIILHFRGIFSNLHRMGCTLNTLTSICNLMIVPCNQLVGMVIEDDATHNDDASTLGTVSI
jgi:hypothetical protein